MARQVTRAAFLWRAPQPAGSGGWNAAAAGAHSSGRRIPEAPSVARVASGGRADGRAARPGADAICAQDSRRLSLALCVAGRRRRRAESHRVAARRRCGRATELPPPVAAALRRDAAQRLRRAVVGGGGGAGQTTTTRRLTRGERVEPPRGSNSLVSQLFRAK